MSAALEDARFYPAGTVGNFVSGDGRQAIRCYLKAGFKSQDEQVHKFGRPVKPYRMLHLAASKPAPTRAH